MITAVRYAEITGDTDSAASAVSAKVEEAVVELEEYLDRPLASGTRTEQLRPDGRGRLWPRAIPITDGGDLTVDGLALIGGSPFPDFLSATTSIEVTYTGGWTVDNLPVCIARDLAWAAYRLLHPQPPAALSVPAGATSVSIGDASVSFGAGGVRAAGDTTSWWSKRTKGYRYAPIHTGPDSRVLL